MKKIILALITTLLISVYVVSAQHFSKVWEGNGYEHMNFYIYQAQIDGIDLEPGDEIGIFDSIFCVGVGIVTETISVSSPLTIITSMDDPTTSGIIDGFRDNKPVKYIVYDSSANVEISDIDIYYSTGIGKFVFRGSASLTLNALSPNTPPYFSSSPITTATEDALYTYNVTANDSDVNSILSLGAPGLPPWLTFVVSGNGTGVLSGTPGDLAVGADNLVVLTLTDGIIDSLVTQSFNISVTNVNDTPVIVSSAVTFAQVGTEYQYNIQVEDNDINETITITAPTKPAWLTLTDNGNGSAVLSGTPTATDIGENSVVITATDAGGSSISQTYTINVSETNTPPEFTSTPVTTALENQIYTYNITGSDADAGTSLIFSSTTLPSWLILTDNGNGTALLEGTPVHDDIGENPVVINVTDGIATVEQSFTVTVTATSNAPIILTSTLSKAKQDSLYNQDINFQDIDSDVLYVKLVTRPAWLTIQGATDSIQITLSGQLGSITLTGTPTSASPSKSQVTIRVSDGTYIRSKIYTLEVIKTNTRPVAKNISKTIIEDKQVFVTLIGEDVETPNDLDYEIVDNPLHGTLEAISLNLYSYRPTANYFGADSFYYRVIDAGELDDTGKVRITVQPVNDAPTISISNTGQEMFENNTLNFTVTMSDSKDGANAAILKFITPFGPFNGTLEPLDGDSTTGFLQYTPNTNFVGTDVVFLAAKETNTPELLASSPPIMVTILVKNVNEPPIAFERDIFLKEDHERKFRLFGFDREDDINLLRYEILVPPAHYDSISLTGNKVAYIPELNYFGPDTFQFTVIDTEDAKDTASVFIDIEAVKDKPVALPDTVYGDRVSESIDIDFATLSISDAEDTDVNNLKIRILRGGNGIFNGTTTQLTDLQYTYDGTNNDYRIDFIMYKVIDTDSMKSEPQILFIDSLPGDYPAGFGQKGLKADTLDPIAINDTIRLYSNETREIVLAGADLTPPFNELNILITQHPQYGTYPDSKSLKAVYTPGSPVSSASAIYAPTANDTEVILDKIKFKVTDDLGHSSEDSIIIIIDSTAMPPVITDDVGNPSVNEDESKSLTILYDDPDSDTSQISWTLSSNPELSGISYAYTKIDLTEVSLSITPPADFAGNIVFLAKCTDQSDLSDSVEFNLEAINVNDAPDLKDINDQSTIQNTELTLLLFAEDIDSDSLTYSAISESGNDSISIVGDEMTIIPKSGFTGTDTINVTVNDNDDTDPLTNTKSFVLEVIADDDAPHFSTTILNQETDEDVTFPLQITPLDSKSNDLITVSVESANQALIPETNITIDSISAYSNVLRNIEFSPVADLSGSSKITIYLDDSEGNQTTQQFTLTVKPVDDPPVLDAINDITMNEDYTTAISLSGTDIDSDAEDLSFSASSVNQNLNITTNGNLVTISSLNDYYGTTEMQVLMSDGTTNDSATVNIIVNNVQDIPVVTSTPVRKATEDSLYSYSIEVYEPDLDDSLSLSGTIPEWLNLSSGLVLSGTPTNDDVGIHVVSLNITDNVMTGYVTHEFVIVVSNINDAPTFTSTANITGTVGSAYSYNITVEDVDAGAGITIAGVSLPTWLSLTDNGDGTASLTGTPTATGDFSITITATDGIITTPVEQTFTITVAAGTNNAPTFTSTAVTSGRVGSAYTYNITASDINSDDLTITAVDIPTWLSLTDNGDGTATLTGTPTTAGSYNVTIAVSDGIASPVEQTFTIVVSITGVDELNSNSYFTIYPIPSDGIININLKALLTGKIEINVYNIEGQIVLSNSIFKEAQVLDAQIDLTSEPSGFYHIEVRTNDRIITQKILIE